MKDDGRVNQGSYTKVMFSVAAAGGVIWFLVSAVVAQVLHPHTLAAASLSDYLRGPESAWLRASYYGFAAAVGVLGVRMLVLHQRVRSAIASMLLFVSAFAIVVAAYSYSRGPIPGHPTVQERMGLHLLSAFTAFGCVTLTLLIATPLLWHGRARRFYFILAGTVVALELFGFTLPHLVPGVYGAFEKLGIAIAMLWLIGAALRLAGAKVTKPMGTPPSQSTD